MTKMTMNKKGFTLIELLLAMTIFSFVLILTTSTFVQINRLYLKSNIVAQTQNQARNLMEDVVRTIKLSDNEVIVHKASDKNRAYCIGRTIYAYSLNDPLSIEGLQGEVSVAKAPRASLSYQYAETEKRHSAAFRCGGEAVNGLDTDPSSPGLEYQSVFFRSLAGDSSVHSLLDEGFVIREFEIFPIFRPGENEAFAYQIAITVSHGEDELFVDETAAGAATICSGRGGTASSFCAVTRLETTVFRRIK